MALPVNRPGQTRTPFAHWSGRIDTITWNLLPAKPASTNPAGAKASTVPELETQPELERMAEPEALQNGTEERR